MKEGEREIEDIGKRGEGEEIGDERTERERMMRREGRARGGRKEREGWRGERRERMTRR